MPINLPALSPAAVRAFNSPRWRRWLGLWARRSLYPVSILAGILYQFLRWPIVLAFVVCVALAIHWARAADWHDFWKIMPATILLPAIFFVLRWLWNLYARVNYGRR